MSTSALQLGALVLAGCWILCGTRLAVTGERLAGVLLVLGGVAVVLGVLDGTPLGPVEAAVVAGQLCGPGAALAYGPGPSRPGGRTLSRSSR